MPVSDGVAAPVLVRNKEKGCSVFTDSQSQQSIEWQGFGDSNGEDFQHVPLGLVQTPAFLKAMTKGIYEIIEADEHTTAALQAQAVAWRKRQDAIDSAARNSTEGRTAVADLNHVKIDDKGQITSIAQPTGVNPATAEEIVVPAQVVIDPSSHRTRQPATQ